MKRMTTLLLTAVLLLSLIACGAKDAWQEQYDLGMRYLNDGNYEDAIIAFEAAIEIDAKRPEAYLGAAEVYIAVDDVDAAITILEKGLAATGDNSLQARLDEIKNGSFSDFLGRKRRVSHYDGAGDLSYWLNYEYNDPEHKERRTGITSYSSNGEPIQHLEEQYDEQGREIYGLYSSFGDGTMVGATSSYNNEGYLERVVRDSGEAQIYYRNEEGQIIRGDNYSQEGVLENYTVYEYGSDYHKRNTYDANGTLVYCNIDYYDQQGQQIRHEQYDGNGNMTICNIYEYAADGRLVAVNHYNGNGEFTGQTTYN